MLERMIWTVCIQFALLMMLHAKLPPVFQKMQYLKKERKVNLGCNPSMIRAGKPQCRSASHPLIPYHDVLQRHKQGMAHVQLSSDIGRRPAEK